WGCSAVGTTPNGSSSTSIGPWPTLPGSRWIWWPRWPTRWSGTVARCPPMSSLGHSFSQHPGCTPGMCRSRFVEIPANMRQYACYLCECPLLDVWLALWVRGGQQQRGSMEEKSEKDRTGRRSRGNWTALGVATGVFVLLGVGWPLMNAVTPSTEAVAADH